MAVLQLLCISGLYLLWLLEARIGDAVQMALSENMGCIQGVSRLKKKDQEHQHACAELVGFLSGDGTLQAWTAWCGTGRATALSQEVASEDTTGAASSHERPSKVIRPKYQQHFAVLAGRPAHGGAPGTMDMLSYVLRPAQLRWTVSDWARYWLAVGGYDLFDQDSC